MQDRNDNARSTPDRSGDTGGLSDADDPGGPERSFSAGAIGELPVRLEIEDCAGALDRDALRWLTAAARRAIDAAIGVHVDTEGAEPSSPFERTTMAPHPHPGAAPAPRARRPHNVRVAIVDDERMAALHERHAGEAGTTDVLTFDLRDGAAGPLDVDIVVCIDEARRQGERRGHGFERELLLYILHGALHCLGHDDRDEGSSRLMHLREDEILAAVGVGAVYAPAGSEADPPEIRVVSGGARELNG